MRWFIGNAVQHYFYSASQQVSRCLLQKDKLLFVFLMAVHIKAHVHQSLDMSHMRFLLTGDGHGIHTECT
jgi:hypothetical protein